MGAARAMRLDVYTMRRGPRRKVCLPISGLFPACPLLAQIAEEFPKRLPDVFRAHPLKYLWAFKYDSTLSGINIHADFAAVSQFLDHARRGQL
jgi:hypothetical protein